MFGEYHRRFPDVRLTAVSGSKVLARRPGPRPWPGV